ncbi:MAG TPA: Mur ligase family protein [Gemmatimonadales bacterium]|nr:Mur ligase family protein [Gemmatimonadales bacterium]
MVLPDTVRDSRRLTGPNLLGDLPGAVLDVELSDADAEQAIALWEQEAQRGLAAVGWEGQQVASRRFSGGASLFFSAPVDALYAATELNEWAWISASARLAGGSSPDPTPAFEALRAAIATERRPALLAIQEAARWRGVAFLRDDESVSVGLGAGSITWPADALPDSEAIPWDRVHDIPVALVTGSNGKTTSVRLVAAMLAATGRVAGYTSTDGIRVGPDLVEAGDFAGPEGARRLLRDPRVESAVLETARGGILRRGLAVRRADAALVTNLAEDHLGEWGVHTMRDLAAAKLVVARALGEARPLILTADDEDLADAAESVRAPIAWFSPDRQHHRLRPAITNRSLAAWIESNSIVVARDGRAEVIAPLDEVPVTLGGAARHNVANALGASLLAAAMRVPRAAIADGLRAVTNSPEGNPGRLNLFEFGGLRVVLDFAHNPHGLRALMDMAAVLPARRRLVLIGQAGDRDDASIRELARAAWAGRPDRVVVKEMREHARGRPEGEVVNLLAGELRRLGASPAQLDEAASELDGIRRALGWAHDGDLLLLTVHADRDAALGLLRELSHREWRPGDPVPP